MSCFGTCTQHARCCHIHGCVLDSSEIMVSVLDVLHVAPCSSSVKLLMLGSYSHVVSRTFTGTNQAAKHAHVFSRKVHVTALSAKHRLSLSVLRHKLAESCTGNTFAIQCRVAIQVAIVRMSFATTTARPATLYKSSFKSATGQQRRVVPQHGSKGAAFASRGRAAFSRRSTRTVSALPVTELAVAPVFPSLLSLAFRFASAGFLLYSSLQWASARNSRIQVQRNIKDQEQRQSEQKRKLDRLRGITHQDDKQE